jgi:hypothetical protein
VRSAHYGHALLIQQPNKQNRKELALIRLGMRSNALIEQALRNVRNVLWANRFCDMADDRSVACVGAVMSRPDIAQALERGNDTAQCFALRTVKHVLSDTRQPPAAVVNCLHDIMDDLDRAIGVKL